MALALPCAWCGKTYDEHMDKELEGAKVKTPCGMVKGGYTPRQASPTRKSEVEPQVMMNFQDAIKQAIEGKLITKLDWANENIYLLFNNDMLSIHNETGEITELRLHKNDFIGDDWVVITKGE